MYAVIIVVKYTGRNAWVNHNTIVNTLNLFIHRFLVKIIDVRVYVPLSVGEICQRRVQAIYQMFISHGDHKVNDIIMVKNTKIILNSKQFFLNII